MARTNNTKGIKTKKSTEETLPKSEISQEIIKTEKDAGNTLTKTETTMKLLKNTKKSVSDSKNSQKQIISVIIAVTDLENFYKFCSSIFMQSYENIEFIIVDALPAFDAKSSLLKNTDNYSLSSKLNIFLKEYSTKYKKNILIIEYNGEEKDNQNKLFEYGLKLATGDCVAFANSYTIWSEDFVKNSVECLEKSKADFSCANIVIKWHDGVCVQYDTPQYSEKTMETYICNSPKIVSLRTFDNIVIRKDLTDKIFSEICKIDTKDYFNSELLLTFYIWAKVKSFVVVPKEFSAVDWVNQDKFIVDTVAQNNKKDIVKEFVTIFETVSENCSDFKIEDINAFITGYINYYIHRTGWAFSDMQSEISGCFNISEFTDFSHSIAYSSMEHEVEDIYNLCKENIKINFNTKKFDTCVNDVTQLYLLNKEGELEPHNKLLNEQKLQNLIFPTYESEWQDEHSAMFYRGDYLNYNKKTEVWNLESGFAECFTYFNSLSVKKWAKYTGAKNFALHLKIKGEFYLEIFGHYAQNEKEQNLEDYFKNIQKENIPDSKKIEFIHRSMWESQRKKENISLQKINCSVAKEIVIPIEYEESDVVGFILTAVTPLTIYGGYYSAEIEQINDVNIAICSTTFKKEKYIKRNVNLLKEKIYETDNELAEHLYMVVVDNGSSLSENEINGEKIKLVPNANVGGAGGFTRGMLEVIDLAEKKEYFATHVLFMDDDVEINTESLNRTYSLLKFLKPEYKDRFISGAMLNLSQHNIQFENIGFIDEGLASWRSLKPQFDICLYDQVLFNELEYAVNNMYGAWWFCAVPIKFISKENLSLPIFYRTDDIEFSLRNKAEFITLNGIGIWHMPFWDKENEALDYYLSIRNPLVIQATSGVFPKAEFVKRIERDFRNEIRKFNYTACEHLLDALDDFMKGPEFLQSLNGEQKLKSQCTKNQQLIPVSNFGFSDEQMNTAYDYVPLSEQDMQLFEETDNGHTLSDTVLDDKNLPFIAQMFFQSPGKQFLKKHIILTSVPKKSIAILTIDRKKYAELIKRHDELFNYYNENKENIINSYRNQAKNMMSAEFWWGYLEEMKK